jgi:hypothetical protein
MVIAPYATEFGEETLFRVNENERDKIHLAPHEKIKTLSEVLSPSTAFNLDRTLWKEELLDPAAHTFKVGYQKGASSRGNIWFDHKIPNWFSFVYALEAGVVTGKDGSLINGRITKNSSNEPVFIPLPGQDYAPIPKTIPPYKS